ncbi:ABC-2 type transport system ATP-binding protein [Sphingomonas vulcanisoli]|uniref:ABC-2 type transport system ATP-binding protein n=1 Tax=Sphingomonas vulcanisoli TaxID=1658060 RepID=A0ABX0TRM5_9SPHN|nr:ATP-binding cassette domain-containing protein [Sphingomonas vulcanisoli]NIJ08173.1 ABC-2 type transport system ATP-binding protein [Sphingomonas vulcanisoli]
MSEALAVEAHGITKHFDGATAVDGVDLAVPSGSIYGILGPNGAGKTTTLRMLLGIIDPDSGERRLLGAASPLEVADRVGYLPEERGLYSGMNPRDAIAFMGALRGLPLKEGKARATKLLAEHDLPADRPIRTLSKGMAQLVQLLGTIVHKPGLIVLDEPFSGLDAINQERLEALIRDQAKSGATILFSTHVIAHAERLCERIAVIARGKIRFEGTPEEARTRFPSRVRLATRHAGDWEKALPADAKCESGLWRFRLPEDGIEPLLKAVIEADAGIETLAIEPPSLHEAFVAIVGDAGERP